MFRLRHHLGDKYSPTYFLAALGAGGAAVSFFMYLMFMTPHPDTPIPTWESWHAVWSQGDPFMQGLIAFSLSAIVLLTLLHVRLLVWNIIEYQRFKHTEGFIRLKNSNAEVQLMTLPLTFAMSINVSFIVGALFVPQLWSVVEYLFPAAITAFSVVGGYALIIFTHYMSRLLATGQFDCAKNNSLGQMMVVFAFAMIAVGFSAPAAMSENIFTSGISLILTLAFLSIAGVLAVIYLSLGFRAMLQQGIDREGSVSLWIIIPILTVTGIALYRLSMAMHHNFDMEIKPIESLAFFSIVMGIQLFFGLIGLAVMNRLGYFDTYTHRQGEGKSAGSYALICPGIALTVISFFFINKGLVDSGLVAKYSIVYYVLLVPVVILQLKTIMVMLRLNSKLLSREKPNPLTPVTAE
jgi:hypothetical protein